VYNELFTMHGTIMLCATATLGDGPALQRGVGEGSQYPGRGRGPADRLGLAVAVRTPRRGWVRAGRRGLGTAGGRGAAGRTAAGTPADTLNALSLVADAEVTVEASPLPWRLGGD
jgi:hypothetical protein